MFSQRFVIGELLKARVRRAFANWSNRRSAITVVALLGGTLVLGLLWPGPKRQVTGPTPTGVAPAAVETPAGPALPPDNEPALFERIRQERTVRYDRLEVDRGPARR